MEQLEVMETDSRASQRPSRARERVSSAQQRPSNPDRTDTQRTATLICIALLALGAFVLNYAIELQFWKLQALAQWNIFFDADPNLYIASMAHGWGTFNFKHLNVISFFNPPVRVLATALGILGVGGPSQPLRESIALLIVPLFGAMKTALLFLLFRRFGITLLAASLLCLLDLFSFSRIVFGSIPESFPISATVVIALYLLTTHTRTLTDRRVLLLWIALSTLAMGVTITNVIPIVLLLAVPVMTSSRRRRAEAINATMILVSALAINVALAKVFSRVYGAKAATVSYDPRTDKYMRMEPLVALSELRWTVPNTLLAPRPHVQPNTQTGAGYKYDFMFSYSGENQTPPSQVWYALIVLGVCGAAAVAALRAPAMRPLALASLGIIAANVAMHLVFGNEYFLYSMHWQPPLLFLLAGLTAVSKGRIGPALLAAFTIAVAIASFVNLTWMLQVLRAG